MLFNTIDFAIFLPIVFLLYWVIGSKNIKFQNLLIAIASYVFYGWWDWKFLALILFSTIIDYFCGLHIVEQKSLSQKKLFLGISIAANLGMLGFFKYYNFFIENFTSVFSLFGSEIQPNSLNIILPVGISFYTFQTLSYTIDIYRGKLQPTKDFIQFSAFVSFFPQLVAGPIERASNLLPQFAKQRSFEYSKAVDGLRQILWGLFKKVVIADNCAEIVNTVFANSANLPGSTLLIGAILFAFQIYCDFSGYTDIAIGVARLFGFNLTKNFAFPYFSRDIAEFWRRWHISLSTWFRDYLYIPLGGSKGSTWSKVRNTFIIFIVSGFWHGSNWTFIAWGALNAIYFLPLLLRQKNRNHTDNIAEGRGLPSLRDVSKIGFTFSLTTLAWIFFRANNLSHAFQYIKGIFSATIIELPNFSNKGSVFLILALISFMLIVEWIGRNYEYGIERLFITKSRLVRWSFYGLIIFMIGVFMQTDETPFIYFQF